MKFMDWFKSLFKKNRTAPAPAPTPAPAPAPVPAPVTKAPTFVETFQNLDNWIVSTWEAPGANASHSGTFVASNVTCGPDGLRLALTQTKPGSTVLSVGGEVASKQKFGYGRYEFVVRASSTGATAYADGSPVSGSITGCFNYTNASQTEIDIEVEGNERSRTTQCTTWVGENNPNQHTDVTPPSSVGLPHMRFFKYAFVWSPGKVEFYRDDALIATHTKVVPSAPAPMMFNHWGTNSVNWGGLATLDVTRYMYVKSFTFTPL